MKDAPLQGRRIGISGAVPEPQVLAEHRCTDHDVHAAVRILAERILEAGGRIVHGCHPTFTPIIEECARTFLRQDEGRSDPDRPKLVRMYLSRLFVDGKALEEFRARHGDYAEIVAIDVPPMDAAVAAEPAEKRNRALTAMREAMIGDMDALVCIGGKRQLDDPGNRPGVAEEADLAIGRKIPVYLMSSFGGATLDLYQGERFPEVSPRLRERAEWARNQALGSLQDAAAPDAEGAQAARTIDVWGDVATVMDGLIGGGAPRRDAAVSAVEETISATAVHDGQDKDAVRSPIAASAAGGAAPATAWSDREEGAKRPPLRILALDGGGILGAFTAGVLDGLITRAQLEEDHRAEREGRPKRTIRLLDHVDLVAGTSTGGLIAVALGMGKSPKEICDFYQEYGARIFPRSRFGWRSWFQVLRPKYSTEPLRASIRSVVEDRPLSEAGCGLLIPAIDVVDGAIHLFKTDHHDGAQWSSPEVSAVDVALATSAAPTYFKAHTIKGYGTFIDGGLWANCPTNVALTEAVAYLGYDLPEIRMLSVSTTTTPYYLSKALKTGGLLRWASAAPETFMRFSIEGAWAAAKSQLNQRGGMFHRIDKVAPEGIFSMDSAGLVDELIGLGRRLGHFRKHYEPFRDHFLAGPDATLHRGKQTTANPSAATAPSASP